MRFRYALCVILAFPGILILGQNTPLSQRQACAKFSDAVVEINAGGESLGSGFIVSSDGFILTASHVVRNEDGAYYPTISTILADGSLEFATPTSPISLDSVGQDFALLKIAAKKQLPFLTLGSTEEVVTGGDATIIGFPFSALSSQETRLSQRFCLSATFAATDLITVRVNGTNKRLRGPAVPINKDIKVDVIYFQGPSVKGISGSPIISRDTGNVVGIVSTKLTGLGKSLTQLKDETGKGLGSGIAISGLQPGPAINKILVVLDSQLANGLGSAVGIDDPKQELKRAQHKKK